METFFFNASIIPQLLMFYRFEVFFCFKWSQRHLPNQHPTLETNYKIASHSLSRVACFYPAIWPKTDPEKVFLVVLFSFFFLFLFFLFPEFAKLWSFFWWMQYANAGLYAALQTSQRSYWLMGILCRLIYLFLNVVFSWEICVYRMCSVL